MDTLIRSMNWSTTPIGPVESWSPALQTMVRVLLANRFPLLLWWGSQYVSIYNDAYRPILGTKHPWALGKPVSECWKEIWHILQPLIDTPFQGGPATWNDDILLEINRHGFVEETHFTIAYSPVPDETAPNGIGGVLATVHEITGKVVGDRRVLVLRDLGRRSAEARTAPEACAIASQTLAQHPKDIPFALLYLIDPDRKHARLAGTAGVKAGEHSSPLTISLNEQAPDSPWPLADALRDETVQEVTNLEHRLAGHVPLGPWSDVPNTALVVPIHSNKAHFLSGFLVAGVSPRLQLDGSYRDFLNLVSSQIATAIANAREYEEEKKRTEALAEIDRVKTTFFSNVSHEFRTPLTLMLSPLQDTIANANGILPKKAAEELALAHRNGMRLLKLVNTLLDFSRIEAGRVKAVYEPSNFSALTIGLASVFRSAIEKTGMQLIVDCPPLSRLVPLDRNMWEKVVLNLLSNAFKFTLQGAITVTIRESDDAWAELKVSDTGSGIPEHEIPRLFERFHRVEGTKGRTHEGTGIGLALVQELVKLHGGSIEVQSAIDRGSTFTVRIPMGSLHQPAAANATSPDSGMTSVMPQVFVEEALRWLPDTATNQTQAMDEISDLTDSPAIVVGATRQRVVLADDNADMRQYVRRLLARQFEVEAVADGHAALAAIKKRRPHLVVSDIMMPKLDGFGLLKELRANPDTADIPIILLSARAGEEATLEGLEAGADDYLVKPFSARDFLGRVTALLERKRFQNALAEETRILEILNKTGSVIASQLELQTLVQSVTDAGKELTSAQFGAFFYNVIDQAGEAFLLYTLSGAPREAFEKFGIPRNTPVFEPTFRGTHVVRSDDITRDPRYGTMKPHHGMPPGHLPVRSYLAVPVISRSGEVIGGLFFGHSEVGVFTERAERLIVGIAAQAAVAIDNSRLYERVKQGSEERQTLLEAERVARADAEHSSRIKDEFLATLSHELRTPLNAILGWSQILRSRNSGDAELAEGLEVIDRNTRVQTQLIEDLLDMSRIVSGKLRLDVQKVDVQDVIKAAVASVRHSADAKSIRLQIVLDPLAGPVRGDPARLQQCFWNLLSNAIKFTPKGGKIQVTMERVNSHLEACVVDNGQGIKPEFLPYLFERFRQADASTTRRHGGLGLGLSIVKHLVELHGGVVCAKSAGEGKGATFCIELPLMALHEVEDQTHPQHPRSAHSTETPTDHPSLAGITVLAVDDEPDARQLIQRVLEDCGASVILASSSEEAIDLLRQTRPDMIISDIGMPGEDGYQFIRRVRTLPDEQGGNVPAAALTAFARAEDRTRALRAGFQTHVSKPVEPTELTAVVASLAARRAPRNK